MSAGNTNNRKLLEVTQILNREIMKERDVYKIMGFHKINENWLYLYHGGAIGEGAENIDVDLSLLSTSSGSKDNLTRYCLTDKEYDLIDSLKTSLSFLDIASYKLTIPLLSVIYVAPLFSFFREAGIHLDFILFILGKTGSLKTSATAVALSHYGKFDRDSMPCNFTDTVNAIRKKIAYHKRFRQCYR